MDDAAHSAWKSLHPSRKLVLPRLGLRKLNSLTNQKHEDPEAEIGELLADL